jgi:low affinity Fe/Cu permease
VKAAKVVVRVPSPKAQTRGDRFGRFAARTAHIVGSRWTFLGAIGVVVVWAVTGPLFHYSDTWQLVINTGTTIVTFLMVFLIQNTQNRDARAIHLKLNELIHGVDKAKNKMIDIENLSDHELEDLAQTYENLRNHAQEHARVRRESRETAAPK